MLPLLKDSDEQVRVDAASALGYFGDRRAEPELREALKDSSERVRHFAEYALKQLRARRSVE
jgi:HEAT repeat protein